MSCTPRRSSAESGQAAVGAKEKKRWMTCSMTVKVGLHASTNVSRSCNQHECCGVDIYYLAKLSGLKQRVKMKHFNGQKLSSYRNTPLTKLLQIRDHLIQQISCSGWYVTMVVSHCCFLFFMRARSSTVHSTGYSGGSVPSAAS
jgi:hypothetical protein